MRRILASVVGVMAASVAYAAPVKGSDEATQIRWTRYGVPHIKAADERGLGYGIGYAYAKDNLCLLADEVITARGERARFFGREGQSSAELDNVSSDFFFRWLNGDAALAAFWDAQSEPVRGLLSGYAKGFNRYLRETPFVEQPVACRGQAWLRPISERDLVGLTRRLLVEGGIGRFAQAMLAAAPPGRQDARVSTADPGFALATRNWNDFALQRGSNALAIGAERSSNGHGMLLANPHFPWSGALRFYQLHLTIPGRMDVMGAALPGLPVVNIGFNRSLAWTHTVDTSSHFTLHRLQLDPTDPTRYRVEGQPETLRKRTLSIEVREADGRLGTLEHDIYLSRFGPLVKWPGLLDWSADQAFALHDANLDNTRVLQQWLEMDQADSLATFRAAVERVQGIPWVNTLAVDDQGTALYMNASVVPEIAPPALASCVDPAFAEKGLPVLDGSRSECEWSHETGAAQPGIVPANRLPVLQRRDFVQNSNDSAWLSNPAEPLVGYSPLQSREGGELGMRARFTLQRLAAHEAAPLDEAFLKGLVDGNQVHLAELLETDLSQLCSAHKGDMHSACDAIMQWSRRADGSPGWLYFQAFAERFLEIEKAWRVPFDPQDPLRTPRGIALEKTDVAAQVRAALEIAKREVDASPALKWAQEGALQVAVRGNRRLAIPGGEGELGVYNAIQSRPNLQGQREVIGGSSYIQLVTFDSSGPKAQGLLTFSQSTNPASPHFLDQTEAFSRQRWHRLPFTDAEILADPQYRSLRLNE